MNVLYELEMILAKELSKDFDNTIINDIMNYNEYVKKKNFYTKLGYIKYKGKIYPFPGRYFINDEYIYYGGVPVKLEELEDITKNEVRQLKLKRIL